MYDFHDRCSDNRRYNDEILMAHQLIPEYWCYQFANGVTILTVQPSIPLTQIVIVYNLPKVNGACISCHLKLMIALTNRKTIPPSLTDTKQSGLTVDLPLLHLFLLHCISWLYIRINDVFNPQVTIL